MQCADWTTAAAGEPMDKLNPGVSQRCSTQITWPGLLADLRWRAPAWRCRRCGAACRPRAGGRLEDQLASTLGRLRRSGQPRRVLKRGVTVQVDNYDNAGARRENSARRRGFRNYDIVVSPPEAFHAHDGARGPAGEARPFVSAQPRQRRGHLSCASPGSTAVRGVQNWGWQVSSTCDRRPPMTSWATPPMLRRGRGKTTLLEDPWEVCSVLLRRQQLQP